MQWKLFSIFWMKTHPSFRIRNSGTVVLLNLWKVVCRKILKNGHQFLTYSKSIKSSSQKPRMMNTLKINSCWVWKKFLSEIVKNCKPSPINISKTIIWNIKYRQLTPTISTGTSAAVTTQICWRRTSWNRRRTKAHQKSRNQRRQMMTMIRLATLTRMRVDLQ